MWNPIHASCGRPSGTKVSEAESPESPETCPAGLGWEDCAAVSTCVFTVCSHDRPQPSTWRPQATARHLRPGANCPPRLFWPLEEIPPRQIRL